MITMIDAYSLCPGGTGKKIKFCCRSRLEDFRKIYKYIDANQYTACLNYVDTLLRKDSECACLLAIRCILLKTLPDSENYFIETAKRFYVCHPENPIAIAESAYAILLEGLQNTDEIFDEELTDTPILQMHQHKKLRNLVRASVSRYEKAFCTSQPFQYEQVFQNLVHILQKMLKAGFYESVTAWLGVVPDLNLESETLGKFMKMLSQLKTNKSIPLCFRVGLKVRLAPEDAPWKEAFDQIIQNFALKLHWTQAVYDLKTLASQNEEMLKSSTFWYDLALLNEWLCDLDSAEKFWNEYLKCTDVPFYDALEKRIRIRFFNDRLFDDEKNICALDFQLTDVQAVWQKLNTEPTFAKLKVPKDVNDENTQAVFDVLDAPVLSSVEGLEPDEIPVVIATAYLTSSADGKTGHLEVANVMEGCTTFVQEVVESAIKPWITGKVNFEVRQSVSVTFDSILRKIKLPDGLSKENIREINNAHCRSILLNRWINYPLGILGNQSVRNAAQKEKYRVQVETILYILQHFLEWKKINTSVLNELRSILNLSPLPEITASMTETLSPIFYDRLPKELITPEILEHIFNVSRIFNSNNIPRSILETAVEDVRYSPKLRVEILKSLWSLCPHVSKTLETIKKGRILCDENGLSDVFFDVMEVAYSVNEGKFHSVFERIKHIRQEHSNDSDAMQYVTQLSQYMYGVIQNMNPADLSAFQQKSPYELPGMENLNVNRLEEVLSSFRVLPDAH